LKLYLVAEISESPQRHLMMFLIARRVTCSVSAKVASPCYEVAEFYTIMLSCAVTLGEAYNGDGASPPCQQSRARAVSAA